MDNAKLQMENLNSRTKTEYMLIKTKTFVGAYRELRELKNENDENQEDVLTLMVKNKEVTEVDELKLFLDTFDPNYYSPWTNKSALSYAVEQNNLIFAQVLLYKMSGKNEETRKYFFT